MQKSKQYFFIATTALLLATPFANAATPAVAATAAITQPALAAVPGDTAEPSPAAGQPAVKSAPAKADRTEAPASKPADWSMLLVGAGLLLLPRKRRVDNVVR